MAISDKRLRFYNGQFLQEQDFTAEQEYHLDRQRRHNRQLHTWGIAEGLTVTVGATSVEVSPGTALDGEGRQIVLTESQIVQFDSLEGSVLVVISYGEESSDPATVGGRGGTRWLEKPVVEVIAEADAPPADLGIRLARLQIADDGTVSEPDTTVRTSAGVRLGTEVSLERLRLSRRETRSELWPVLSSSAASQADVTGNLAVSGNLVLGGTGTVGGRLDVNGTVGVQGLTLPTGAGNGLVLTSDAAGEGTWQPVGEAIPGRVPIGSIVAWHKSMTGTPALPDEWIECNGQKVFDLDSPYHGQVVPDLNGGGRFLRGSATSGKMQADAFQGHWHQVENVPSSAGFYYGGPFYTVTGDNTYSAGRVQNPATDGVNGPPRTANETRPVNMSVVWIMRIK